MDGVRPHGILLGALDQKTLTCSAAWCRTKSGRAKTSRTRVSRQLITQNTYPAGHPYSWTVIGEWRILDAASMDDVKDWFKTYYGPSNVTIVLAGDIDFETAKEKVEKYFGNIPPGPPVAHQEVWIAKMTGTHRQIVQDRVPQARIYKVWNIPEYGSADADYLDLVSDVLTQRKDVALLQAAGVRRSDCDGRWRRSCNSARNRRTIPRAGDGAARAGPAQVEKELDEELARFLKEGPTAEELAARKGPA